MSEIKKIKCDALVVGCGAAGYSCAVQLKENGIKDVLLISESADSGTSRNAGSDKQTYYKLSMGTEEPDSVTLMARDLFAGGCVDGDSALCEAANSLRCFMSLSKLGVGFPVDEYGVFVGYKTDHDKRGRATSAGPLTSKIMTEALEKRAVELGVERKFGLKAVELIKVGNRAAGLVAVDDKSIYSIRAKNIVFATGGPAAVYSESVYPKSQTGATGVLLRAGAVAQNLTEWQFGLASTNPRWNVSGTYMQVLPSFVSVDESGVERRFLEDSFESAGDCLNLVFLKGYEWPFDSRKLSGSSIIDILVYKEKAAGRRVYLDYTVNPYGFVKYSSLSDEAREYLTRAGACFGNPIDRLLQMNEPAYEFYLSHGVDLAKQRLEISLCAQHCNGGISVDANWNSSVDGLFVVGEAAGTHGVYRPGGSALNAGQVGALRAAAYISKASMNDVTEADFEAAEQEAISGITEIIRRCSLNPNNSEQLNKHFADEMSLIAGALRDPRKIDSAIESRLLLLKYFSDKVGFSSDGVQDGFLLRDSLYTSVALLTAMRDFYTAANGGTRGSAIYLNSDGDEAPFGFDEFRYKKASDFSGLIQETYFSEAENAFCTRMRAVREIPKTDTCFENVWRLYRERL